MHYGFVITGLFWRMKWSNWARVVELADDTLVQVRMGVA